jgi:predicted small metal-binding protein
MAKKFTCEEHGPFMVQSNDENEVVRMAEIHMKQHHPDMKLSHDDIKAKLVDA